MLDKEQGLAGRGLDVSSVNDQLTIFVLSYDSFKNKEGRKAYQENSALMQLTNYQKASGMAVDVEGADDTALISALSGLNPIVVVDESHHAKSDLSLGMLRNLNPRFVLELTATPSSKSNVIARVSALELKKEQMVKLPVIVYRRDGKREVVEDAILLQRRLELIAGREREKTGRYIRPIVLFQAERRGADDAETFRKLKEKIVNAGIPDEQIAIRTGNVDELKDVDLMSEECPIRFIITVEALSEAGTARSPMSWQPSRTSSRRQRRADSRPCTPPTIRGQGEDARVERLLRAHVIGRLQRDHRPGRRRSERRGILQERRRGKPNGRGIQRCPAHPGRTGRHS